MAAKTPSPARSPQTEPRNLRPRNSVGCPLKSPPKQTVSFQTPPPSEKRTEVATPRSILKSPYKSPYNKSKNVEWKEVEVRHYNRCHGGSAGVPTKGIFPLGLDWAYDSRKVLKKSVTDYEKHRRNSVGEDFHRIPEKVLFQLE
jgi:hypothetical protein